MLFVSCKSLTWENGVARKNLKGHLIGIIDKNHLKKKPYQKWYDKHYSEYTVNKEVVKKSNLFKDICFVVFIGTWCDDSQKHVSHLYKILDKLHFDYKNIKIVGVNKRKKARGLEKNYRIDKVPTFFIYKNDRLIGEIIEHPTKNSSLEKDILKIIENKN